MKALLRNNIFTNPGGWAQKVVGTPWSYRFTQAATIFFSIALFVLFMLVSRPLPWTKHLGVGFSIAVVTLVFPLCYLRALRCLYLRNRRKESDQPATAADHDNATAE
jgi:hypothetical protein